MSEKKTSKKHQHHCLQIPEPCTLNPAPPHPHHSTLMKSVSGIRGIWTTDITPEVVFQIVANFGLFQRKRYPKKRIKILVGRDSRTTGESLYHCAISALLSVGVDVVALGMVATPTLLYNVKHLSANGGIVITASHNPAMWNAMKFVDANALFLYPEVMTQFLDTIDHAITYAEYDKMGKLTHYSDANINHIKKILSMHYIQPRKIRKKHFKVVIDSVNGAGCVISEKLLASLGCVIIHINGDPTGIFAHNPEPLAKNLNQVCQAVKHHNADIGFATDPDVDRLAIIDEHGECIGEEFSLLLAECFVLAHKKGTIVTNLSSSMANDLIADRFGVPIRRTRIGEIHVGSLMRKLHSPIGGEGNGGIICPDVNYTRDAVAGMALILAYLASSGKTISALASEIPRFYIAKNKIETTENQIDNILKNAQNLYPDATLDLTDGVKIIFADSWIHIRKSGTEPIVRVYVEADTQERADSICNKVMSSLGCGV